MWLLPPGGDEAFEVAEFVANTAADFDPGRSLARPAPVVQPAGARTRSNIAASCTVNSTSLSSGMRSSLDSGAGRPQQSKPRKRRPARSTAMASGSCIAQLLPVVYRQDTVRHGSGGDQVVSGRTRPARPPGGHAVPACALWLAGVVIDGRVRNDAPAAAYAAR